ncbi:MAG: hypothetical protein HOH33_14000, partial [Verrucomicrobia bacterium]|nr:hypothetical protein [Verrucomicrobiota bacterium]
SHRWVTDSVIEAATTASNGSSTGVFGFAGGNAQNADFVWVYNRYKHQRWAPIDQ